MNVSDPSSVQKTVPDSVLRAWWRLARLPRIGNVALNRFRDQLSSVEELAEMQAADLESLGLAQDAALRWQQDSALDNGLEALARWCEIENQGVLLAGYGEYPESLACLNDAPTFLFWRGRAPLESLSAPSVALVGSRNPGQAAVDWTLEHSAQLVKGGLTVISGMALGIDTAAHRGALNAAQVGQVPSASALSSSASSATTLAVLGCGVDVVYPKRNAALAHEIVENGLLLSEFPPGTPAQAAHFPSRNRIISGLSLGTLVVEAAVKSGSLITARMAAAQGREVMAVPGAVANPLSRGCHSLIRDGALLVESADHVIEALADGLAYRRPSGVTQTAAPLRQSARSPLARASNLSSAAIPSTAGLSSSGSSSTPRSSVRLSVQPEQQSLSVVDTNVVSTSPEGSALLQHIDYSATSVDLMVMRAGLPVHEVLQTLMMLELEGLVSQVAGGYCRVS